MNYINDLDCQRKWKVKWYGRNEAVLFEGGNYTAVIMPIYDAWGKI
jgi:hypothetical protein